METLFNELGFFDFTWITHTIEAFGYQIAADYGDDWQCDNNWEEAL